jgi:hypothetical protein
MPNGSANPRRNGEAMTQETVEQKPKHNPQRFERIACVTKDSYSHASLAADAIRSDMYVKHGADKEEISFKIRIKHRGGRFGEPETFDVITYELIKQKKEEAKK